MGGARLSPWWVRAGLAGLLAAMAGGSAIAQVTPSGFGAFKHVRWGADEGAPDRMFAIAQTPDGYLWLTGGQALYRFDGDSFETIDWPGGTGNSPALASGLMVARTGDLWVGLAAGGGVAVYRGGALRDMHMPDPPRTVSELAEGADGTIWAASGQFTKRLRRLRAGRWEPADDPLGLPAGAVLGLLVAPGGGLWVALSHEGGQSGALAYLAPGARRFRELPFRLGGRPKIALDAQGRLWEADSTGTRRLVDGDGRISPQPQQIPPAAPGLRTVRFAFDRLGGIWGATEAIGVFHATANSTRPAGSAPAMSIFNAASGLTSDFTYAPLIDREGTVWFTTEGGIDQFRRASAVQEAAIPADPVGGLAIAGSNDGSIYIEVKTQLFHVPPHGEPHAILKLASGQIAMCRARAGGVWIVDGHRTLRHDGRRATASPGYGSSDGPNSCAEDQRGRLWVALFSGKLIWHDRLGWHHPDGLLGAAKIWDLIAAPLGGIAFTSPPDLGLVDGNRVTILRGRGNASMIAAGLRDLFLSARTGLTRLRDGRFAHIAASRFPWGAQLRNLVQTTRGDTWLTGPDRIARVATRDLDRAFADPRAPLPYTLFDAQDGLASTVQHGGFPGVQSVAGGDGRVWFLNRQGAAFFDPATLTRNTLLPPVAVRWLTTGGQRYRDPADLVLPPGTRAIDIAYAGLSLAVPQRVRFRYRLEGVDDSWVDAGNRRMASYANLGPGRYLFRVIAANNDGVWNRTGATLRFEIRPTFLQSWPFKLLCGAAALGLLWLAYALRLRVVASRIRARMAERMAERERIARELHDTLLQSVQTLTLRFQLAVDDLSPHAPGRQSLIQAIDTADHVIAEGRDRVRDLRSRHAGDIGQILCDMVARLDFDPEVGVTISIIGTPRALEPLAIEEVARIAGEALVNVWRHAGADRVTIAIRHGTSFSLSVTDDGIGIDPALAAEGRAGHFGLPGMRERALKLRGTLTVRALPGRGTELLLTVPGAIAYVAAERSLFARFWSHS